MTSIKQLGITAVLLGTLSAAPAWAQDAPADAANFYTSDKVIVQPVVFKNQYKRSVNGSLK